MQVLDGGNRLGAADLGAWDMARTDQAFLACSSDRREAPLACLHGKTLATRFHAWHGQSGTRYLVSVFAIDHDNPAAGLPDLGSAVLIAVTRRGRARAAVGLRAIERDSDWARAMAQLHAGADEWHVHLLAPDRAARAAVLTDLGGRLRLAVVA